MSDSGFLMCCKQEIWLTLVNKSYLFSYFIRYFSKKSLHNLISDRIGKKLNIIIIFWRKLWEVWQWIPDVLCIVIVHPYHLSPRIQASSPGQFFAVNLYASFQKSWNQCVWSLCILKVVHCIVHLPFWRQASVLVLGVYTPVNMFYMWCISMVCGLWIYSLK